MVGVWVYYHFLASWVSACLQEYQLGAFASDLYLQKEEQEKVTLEGLFEGKILETLKNHHVQLVILSSFWFCSPLVCLSLILFLVFPAFVGVCLD
jgi:hypothetical protein